jgi:hypothetical protein
VAVLILVVVWAAPGVRALKAARAAGGGDRAGGILALAVRGLPADRAAWGQAMLVELDQARGTRARWRFSLGCARAATALRIRATFCARDRGAKGMRAVLLSGVLATLLLSVFGVLRYPGLRAGPAALGAAGVVLVVMLTVYALCALSLLRGATVQLAGARRRGLLAGVGIAAAWLVVLAPMGLQTWVLIPLAIILICPWSIAAFTARVSPDARAAPAAALWSGLVGGLLVFVVWVTAIYLNDGRPYDPQLIRDFHHSGAHDLATYAVNSGLDSAIGLLVVIPIVCFALGSLAGRLTGRQAGHVRRAPD